MRHLILKLSNQFAELLISSAVTKYNWYKKRFSKIWRNGINDIFSNI